MNFLNTPNYIFAERYTSTINVRCQLLKVGCPDNGTGDKWPAVSGAVIFICLGFSTICFLLRTVPKEADAPRRNLSLFLLVLFIAFSVIVRLAFIEELYAPLYFDSVEHYSAPSAP